MATISLNQTQHDMKDLYAIYKQISTETAKVSNEMKKVSNEMKISFKAAAKDMREFVLGAMKSIVTEYLSSADAFGRMSASLGMNITELQAWAQSAENVGGSAQSFYESMLSVNKVLQQAGQGMQTDALKALGIEAKTSEGKVKSAAQVMAELAKVAEDMDPAKFTALAGHLGIDPATVSLLGQKSKVLSDMLEQQKEFAAYTKRDARVAAEANIAINGLKTAFAGLMATALRPLMPIVKSASDAFSRFMLDLKKHEATATLVFGLLAGVITAILLPAIASLFTAFMSVLFASGPIVVGVMAVVAVVALLIKYWDNLRAGFKIAADYIVGKFESILGWINQFLDKIEAAASAVRNFFKSDYMAKMGEINEAVYTIPPVGQPPGNTYANDTRMNIGSISVHTQANDAPGIAQALRGQVASQFSSSSFASGVAR